MPVKPLPVFREFDSAARHAECVAWEIADYAAATIMLLEAAKQGRRSNSVASEKICKLAERIESLSGLLTKVAAVMHDFSRVP